MDRVHQWCNVPCHVNFKGTELYAVKLWVKVITEGPDTTYLPIDNPLIKNSNKTEVPLEGEEEMRIKLKATPHENTNEL